ncbi:hypothetical protein OAT67_06965 [Bacteriovoracaceae bacterium]|nr:hypothetical protein [Bacteriovoracaceae bacterium]
MITAIFVIFPFLLIALSFYFKKRQNLQNQVGGAISLPKSFWLNYTIGSWFFIPIIFLFLNVDQGIKYVFVFHLISWWLRGPLELVMIYKWFNWSPKYGITHDVFHFFIVSILFYYFWPMEVTRPTFLAILYLYGIIVSTFFETLFAILFFKIRGSEKKKIYFASDAPEWKTVNRITILANFICYGLHFVNSFWAYELAI